MTQADFTAVDAGKPLNFWVTDEKGSKVLSIAILEQDISFTIRYAIKGEKFFGARIPMRLWVSYSKKIIDFLRKREPGELKIATGFNKWVDKELKLQSRGYIQFKANGELNSIKSVSISIHDGQNGAGPDITIEPPANKLHAMKLGDVVTEVDPVDEVIGWLEMTVPLMLNLSSEFTTKRGGARSANYSGSTSGSDAGSTSVFEGGDDDVPY